MNQEKWKSISGYPGYDISNQGQIRSYWRRGPKACIQKELQRTIKPIMRNGYPSIFLGKNGKRTFYYIHRLVLLEFKGSCPHGMESCHNDGNHKDSCIKNLRWDTPINNAMDKKTHGMMSIGEKHGMSKLTETQVIEIRKLFCQGYSQRKLAKMFSVCQGTISPLINRKTWAHVP